MERSNIYFYGLPDAQNRRPERPLNVMFLTSIRDVGASDLNGRVVDTSKGPRYMEGAIERVVRESRPGGRLHDLINVVGIVTDDRRRDLRGTDYPVSPERNHPWIFPQELVGANGLPLRDVTFNIPSDFRGLPLDALEERRVRKLVFEGEVLQQMRKLGGDVIVSDHYMAQIDHLYNWLPGRVLNIHPAVTKEDHPFCFTGKTPTADAIAYAQGHDVARTGATLHFVAPIIDTGPIIAFTDGTPVENDDEPQWLRHRNYGLAKNPVLIEGLSHYVQNIYANLGRADLNNLQPVGRP